MSPARDVKRYFLNMTEPVSLEPLAIKGAQWTLIYRNTFFRREIQALERAARSQSHAEEGLGDILKRAPRVRRRL
jgi:hypothetical protein